MGRKSTAGKSAASKKSFKYDKLKDADADLVNQYDDFMEDIGDDFDMGGKGAPLKSGKRDHEIYDKTYYIPNDKLRLLEVPMNGSLYFQMLLYYHGFYDMLYAFLLIPSGIYKIFIGGKDALIIVSLVLTVLFSITEVFRLNFGYQGNINESFPELMAFLI